MLAGNSKIGESFYVLKTGNNIYKLLMCCYKLVMVFSSWLGSTTAAYAELAGVFKCWNGNFIIRHCQQR